MTPDLSDAIATVASFAASRGGERGAGEMDSNDAAAELDAANDQSVQRREGASEGAEEAEEAGETPPRFFTCGQCYNNECCYSC